MSALRLIPRIPRPLSRTFLTSLPRLTPSSPSDPYPLPLSDPDFASVASRSPRPSTGDPEWPMPTPLDRTGEDTKTLRARLVYQTRKRGTLETDLILSTFAREELGGMSAEELMEFDKVGSAARGVWGLRDTDGFGWT